jgi:hypothetical protein
MYVLGASWVCSSLQSGNACCYSGQNLLSFHLLSKNRGVEKTTEWGALWFVLLTRYFSGDQIKRFEMVGAVAHTCQSGGTYKVFMMTFEGCRPHGKPWHRWEGKQLGWEGPVGVIHLQIGETGGLVWAQSWTFRLCIVWGSSWLAEELLTSHKNSVHIIRYLVSLFVFYLAFNGRMGKHCPSNLNVLKWWKGKLPHNAVTFENSLHF